MTKDEKVRKFLLANANKLSNKDWKQCIKSEIMGEIEMTTSISDNKQKECY